MTSRHGDRTAACLKELSLLFFKLLVIEQIPQSHLNINKNGIFILSKNEHDTFSTVVSSIESTPRYRNSATEWKSSICSADEWNIT